VGDLDAPPPRPRNDFRAYFEAAWAIRWLIVLIVFVAGAAVLAYYATVPTTYRATAQVRVATGARALATVNSDAVRRAVAARLNLRAAVVKRRVRVRANSQRVVVSVRAEGSSGESSAELANTYAAELGTAFGPTAASSLREQIRLERQTLSQLSTSAADAPARRASERRLELLEAAAAEPLVQARKGTSERPSAARMALFAMALALLFAITCAAALELRATQGAFASRQAAADKASPSLDPGQAAAPSDRHVAAALAVLAVYLALADGYVKLRTGIQATSIVRDVILYGLVVYAVVFALRSRRLEVPPLTGWVLLFVGVVLVQVANPDAPGVEAVLGGIRQHVEFVPLFFLGYFFIRSQRRVHSLLVLMLIVATINGLVSYAQSTLTLDEVAALGPGYRDRVLGENAFEGAARRYTDDDGIVRVRPFGLGSDSGFGGLLGLIALPGAFALLANARQWRYRLLVALGGSGVLLAIMTSQSRSAVAGSVLALAAYLMLTITRRTALSAATAVAAAAVVAVAVAVALPSGVQAGAFDRYRSISPARVLSETSDYRSGTLAVVRDYALDYPLGAGLGRTGPAAASGSTDPGPRLNAETEMTFLQTETGLPGVALFLAFSVFVSIILGTRVRRIVERDQHRALAALAAPLITILCLWPIQVTSATAPYSPFFWCVAGIFAYAMISRVEQSGASRF
jgi:hypothetical protein